MRSLLPFSLLLSLALVVPAAADARVAGLTVASPNRASLADGARLRVAVPARSRGQRLVVGLSSTRGRPLRVRTLSVPRRRSGRVTKTFALTATARRRLRGCRDYRLTLRLVRRDGRTAARASRPLRAAPGCGRRRSTSGSSSSSSPAGAPNRGGQGAPGAGAAGGAGAGNPGGSGPGAGSQREPVAPGFDTSDFDRCDALDPAVCLQPFPSNHFLKGEGADRKVTFAREAMPKNRAGKPIEPSDYALNDGFSPGSKLITKVPGLDTLEAFRATGLPAIDDPAASQSSDSPLVVINATTGRKHMVWSELDLNPADEDRQDRNLIVRPAVNFDESTRYVVALRRMRRADGSIIPPSRAFEVYRDGIVTTDAKVEARRPQMEAIFATLARAGVARDDLFLAWDFTVASAESTTGRMLSIRDDAFRQLGDTNLADLSVPASSTAPTTTLLPDLPDATSPEDADGVRNFTPAQNSRIARRIRGRIVVPCYLTNGCEQGGRFQFADARGRQPRQLGSTTQPFTCNIPRRALDGPTPEQVRPGLYGHGLFGSQGEGNGGQLSAFAEEHGFGFCAVDWDGMAFEDVPTAVGILQDLSQFPLLTDHVQQGILNFLYLGRAMIHPQGLSAKSAFRTAGGEPVFDTTRLFYDGNSQGGIYGGTLAAVGVDHDRAVLGVPGMNYSTLLRRSVDFDTYAEGDVEGFETAAGLYDNYPSELERPLILALIQMLWDRSDPNGYAHHMTDDPLPNTPPHEVLLHPAFGDHQVADVAATVMARTVGARLHVPVLENGRPRFVDAPYGPRPDRSFAGLDPLPDGFTGSGMVIWDTGPLREDGAKGTPPPPAGNLPPRAGNDPHSAPRSSALGRQQKAAFLRVGGTIPDVCGGGPCFADGYAGAGG